jgi:uncharacterized protein (TIGR02118 family)
MPRFSWTAIVLVQLASFGCRPTQAPPGGAALIVLYPRPSDTTAFELKYTREHMPMVTAANFKGLTQFVASKILATPTGSTPQFYRVAELRFASLADLQAAMTAPAAQRVAAHADSISTGGHPLVFIAEVRTQ